MTRGMKILRGAPNVFRQLKGRLLKQCWAGRGGGGAPKSLYTSKPTRHHTDWMVDIRVQVGTLRQ